MNTKIKTLSKEKLIKLLKKHNNELKKYQVKKIGIFGSYAKDEHTEQSDIDFIVEFKKPTLDNFMDLTFYLEKLFARKVDILTPIGIKSIRIKAVADDILRNVLYV